MPAIPGSRSAVLVAIVIVAAVLAPTAVAAEPCEDRCAASYSECAAVKAEGCEFAGEAAGQAAQDLISDPLLGAFFGVAAQTLTADTCRDLLSPCEEIRGTCLAECPAAPAAPGVTAPPPVPVQKLYGTLRVFSDHPRTIVYLNGQRMGATPQDTLEPFITPELAVGKYWVRLVTPDGQWEWIGEKDLDEGNVNAFEGTLVNVRDRDWNAAVSLEQEGRAPFALLAYREYAERYPDDTERSATARQRVAALTPLVQATEQELYERIESEQAQDTVLALCQLYLDGFPEGAHRYEVEQIAASTASAAPPPPDAAVPAAGEEVAEFTLGNALLLGGLGGLAVGGLVGAIGFLRYKDVEDSCKEGDCAADELQDVKSLAITADVVMGVGAAVTIAGIVVMIVESGDEEEPEGVALGVAPTPTGSGVMLGIGGEL